MLFLLAVPGCAEKPFDALDRIKREKGEQFVLCTLQRFVADYAKGAMAARAYIEREAVQ